MIEQSCLIIMAGKVSYLRWQKSLGRRFVRVLSSALLEWMLISLLLINGVLSYLITWFARYCDLPIPCLLCSRLDHVLGGERAGFYWNMMCRNHKSEISSLVLCTHHEKLVDVHGMCENCLFSFATKDKTNSETYRLLVGKLGADPNNDMDDFPLVDDPNARSSSAKMCSCCSEPWTSRAHAQVLLKTKSTELGRVDVGVPLSRGLRLNWNGSNKENRRPNILAASSAIHGSFEDCSPHFGYSELKLHSDVESEDHTCDEEDSNGIIYETYHSCKEVPVDSLQAEPLVTKRIEASSVFKPSYMDASSLPSSLIDHRPFQSDTLLEKPIVLDSSVMEPLNLINHGESQSDLIKPIDATSGKPTTLDASVSEPPNLIDHEPSHSDLMKSHDAPSTLPAAVGHGLEELIWQDVDLKTESSPLSGLINISNVLDSPNAADVPIDPLTDHAGSWLNESEVALELEQKRAPENIDKVNEAEKEQPAMDSKSNKDINDGQAQGTNSLDLGDAYKLALSSSGRQLSGKTLDQLAGKDSTRVSGDLKLLLSQLSAARRLELPITGIISPRVSTNHEDSRSSDSLTLVGMQMLHRRFSLERNDSRNSLESVDMSSVSEIDGESEIDRLRRQVDHDKKLMSALCRELEEERSASAVAANQALAMITRLQEEKAALQMEALQDIRMMEEQAEYDVEALERANDFLAEKEKEIQDLEAELDYYRIKYPDDDDELGLENEEDLESSRLGFEDERLYVSQQLSNLEKKLYTFTNGGAYPELTNGDFCKKVDPEQGESKLSDDETSMHKSMPLSVSGGRSLTRRVNSFKTPKPITQDSLVHTEAEAASLVDEVSTLNERLQALEADKKFIEHAINSLKNGQEGLRFVEEIASHLRELRRVGIKRKQSSA